MHAVPRIPYREFRQGLRPLLQLHRALDEVLDPKLAAIIRLRASQMNGCAYCIDLHIREARSSGESEDRIALLVAWRKTGLFSERERTALELAEALTALSPEGVPDALLEECEAQFEPQELAVLLYTIADINAWNRLAVGARTPVGLSAPAAAATR